MRCACPNCGAFMPQAEGKALCVCTDCGNTCDACLGGSSQPMSLDKIKALAQAGYFDEEESEQ